MINEEVIIKSTMIEQLHCSRCGYSWYPRKPKLPDVCPQCKSRYWNKERQMKKEAKENGKA